MHTKIASKGFKLWVYIARYKMADKIRAKDLAENKGDFVLIDVREAHEVTEDGTIEGAVNIYRLDS